VRPFRDRADAGRRLAERLRSLPLPLTSPVVLALPRGGVPVGAEVAAALGAPFDVFVARKVGAPGHEEYGIGAVAEGLDEPVVSGAAGRLGLSDADVRVLAERARGELDARVTRYRGGRPLLDVTGKDVVLVDDGLATGVTAEAALVALRRAGPRSLVLAVPVCAPDAAERLRSVADDVVCVHAPRAFFAVGQWYRDFTQTTDGEVLRLLARSSPAALTVEVAVESGALRGDLVLPAGAGAVVVFAHGSGSGRLSPRNRLVAARLQQRGLGTLLLDLLTEPEEVADARTAALRFDIGLLAGRLERAVEWLDRECGTATCAIGYFGASTGAGAALAAAARQRDRIGAVVSRGGRPDLAEEALGAVLAPTLLIVGSRDDAVLRLNRDALARLRCEARLEVVAGATHLFEERGALEQVADLAAGWFTEHLAVGSAPVRV
jgi:putative phosphoribosyl transferase